MTPERLAEIEELANAATPGPWRHERLLYSDGTPYNTNYQCWRFVEPAICGLWDGTDGPESADADFIAAARTDVPALCATVRKLILELESALHAKDNDNV